MRHESGIILAFGIGLAVAASVRAGAIVGATEFTQIANNAELAASYSEHLQHTIQQQEMIANQLNAFRLQLQNTKKLDGLNWGNATNVLNQLARNVRAADGLAYAFAAEDTAFRALHKDYAEYFRSAHGPADLAETYGQWSKFNRDAALKAAKAAGISAADADAEAARIEALKAAGATAEGQMQAMMAGNALSAELLDQMRVLRQLLAQQIDAQSRYKLIEQEEADEQRAHDAVVMDEADDECTDAKGYGKIE